MVVTVFGEQISCEKAVKGTDFAKLFDEKDVCIFEATNVSDFSDFSIEDGAWSEPEMTDSERIAELEAIVAQLLYGGVSE